MEARQRLMIAVPAALLLILTMLYFAFGSLQYGLLIFSAIPLSAIGGIFSLWLRDMPFSISAGVGFIALFGVAVLNGIVLLSEFNRLTGEEGLSPMDAVLTGTRNRLRPVLMTAAVASLGFLPMALSQSAGAEVQRPLATVVIGGLVTATLLTLFLLPGLYLLFERRRRPPVATAALFLLPLLFAGQADAQPLTGTPASTAQILRIAERRNPAVANNRRLDAYWQELANHAFDPPRTQAGIEYGNINSFNRDTRLFLGQGLQLPAVYARARDNYLAGLRSNQALSQLKLHEVRHEARALCNALMGLQERDALLRRLDTVYARSAAAAELLFRTGETGRLAKASSEAYAGQIRLQRTQLREDIAILQQRLSLLLDTSVAWLPQPEEPRLPAAELSAADLAPSHPRLAYLDAVTGTRKTQVGIEKSRLSPDINLGYSNLSIIGWQSPDGVVQKYYGAGDRFGIFQFSMGLPIFNGAARAKIRAAQVEADVAGLERDRTEKELNARLQEAGAALRKHAAALEWYRGQGLREAEVLEADATAGLSAGSLSYAEWALLMDQAVRIRLGGLEARDAVRKTLADISFFTGKD